MMMVVGGMMMIMMVLVVSQMHPTHTQSRNKSNRFHRQCAISVINSCVYTFPCPTPLLLLVPPFPAQPRWIGCRRMSAGVDLISFLLPFMIGVDEQEGGEEMRPYLWQSQPKKFSSLSEMGRKEIVRTWNQPFHKSLIQPKGLWTHKSAHLLQPHLVSLLWGLRWPF